MIFLDVLYVALATVGVMALLQVLMFVAIRVMYPPEPKVIYREMPAPVQQAAPTQNFAPQPELLFPIGPPPTAIQPPQIPPTFTQPSQEVQLPEYEPRLPAASTSVRLDAGLPDGLQETRPPGT
jgi:hypothetical protein